jgi:hypothetical protein
MRKTQRRLIAQTMYSPRAPGWGDADLISGRTRHAFFHECAFVH